MELITTSFSDSGVDAPSATSFTRAYYEASDSPAFASFKKELSVTPLFALKSPRTRVASFAQTYLPGVDVEPLELDAAGEVRVTRDVSSEDAMRDARVQLLARRFEGEASMEDDARFMILTERLRRLDQEENDRIFAAIEETASKLEGVAERAARARAKFGL